MFVTDCIVIFFQVQWIQPLHRDLISLRKQSTINQKHKGTLGNIEKEGVVEGDGVYEGRGEELGEELGGEHSEELGGKLGDKESSNVVGSLLGTIESDGFCEKEEITIGKTDNDDRKTNRDMSAFSTWWR